MASAEYYLHVDLRDYPPPPPPKPTQSKTNRIHVSIPDEVPARLANRVFSEYIARWGPFDLLYVGVNRSVIHSPPPRFPSRMGAGRRRPQELLGGKGSGGRTLEGVALWVSREFSMATFLSRLRFPWVGGTRS